MPQAGAALLGGGVKMLYDRSKGLRQSREEERAMINTTLRLACIAALALVCVPAFGQDMLKLAVGQRGLWDTSISDVGQRAGIFKKHGLTLEILYTQGAGETQQAVISGGVATAMRSARLPPAMTRCSKGNLSGSSSPIPRPWKAERMPSTDTCRPTGRRWTGCIRIPPH